MLFGSVTKPVLSAEIKNISLTLKDVESAAVSESLKIKASVSEVDAATMKAETESSFLWPLLTVDGSWKYSTKVPELNVGPMSVQIGDHNVYSIGPTLTYTLIDFGAVRKNYKSLSAARDSKVEESKVIKKQTVLTAKATYFNILLASERLRLVADSLKLSISQAQDIQNRLKAGASSRMDAISADREVLNYQLQFRQSQADLSTELRTLFAQIGRGQNENVSLPIDNRIDYKTLKLFDTPTIIVSLDSLEKATAPEAIDKELNVDRFLGSKHPQVLVYDELAKASHYAEQGANAGHWPKLQLMARSSLDYPNGPVTERVFQNSVGVAASVPLFEASKSSSEAAEKAHMADAYKSKMEQAEIDITRDFMNARDQLENLKLQDAIMKENVHKAEELAKLYYTSYKAGRSSFLELQSANLGLLESKVLLARNRCLMLIQMAIMESLIEN